VWPETVDISGCSDEHNCPVMLHTAIRHALTTLLRAACRVGMTGEMGWFVGFMRVSVDDECRQHNNEIELLFHMLRCFTARYIPQFQFFKEFLDETVSQVGNFT